MKIKKKQLSEIIDTHGDLIGTDDIPQNDANADTQAKYPTDYNAKIGTQPFRYDMLGRFGFTLMPFMEGEDKTEGQQEMLADISDELFELYLHILEDFYRKPNNVKTEFRAISKAKAENDKDLGGFIDFNFTKYANKVVKVMEKHFDKSMKNLDEQFQENLVESKMAEDKMVDKDEDNFVSKGDGKEIRDKKISKIAGLINKLEKKDIDDLINLIERQDG
jgi:arginyl-tRNA synthetase